MSKVKLGAAVLKNLNLLKLLKDGHLLLNKIEHEIENQFKSNISFHKNLKLNNDYKSFSKSFKTNFFSFIMLISIKNTGIDEERVIEYGKIIFSLRTIITSTDNIIDNENKGILFLKEPKNHIVNNTLLVMLGQNLIHSSLYRLNDPLGQTANTLLEKIYSVAVSESLRDLNNYKTYPTPDYISKNILKGIGGELLVLSLISPISLEKDSKVLEKLESLKTGMFKIGISLQKLDDLCDINEDYESSKANFSISKLIHNYGFSLNSLFKDMETQPNKFNKFKKEYINAVIKEALDGFELLPFSMNREDTLILLEHLFKIRGLENYWNIYKKE